MEYLLGFVHSLFTPVNCVGNLGADVLHAVGNFAVCVGQNLSGAASSSASIVTTVASTVSNIGA